MVYLQQVISKCDKNKILIFSYTAKKDIFLVLPKFYTSNDEIKRSKSIKFLGVFLDENHRKSISNTRKKIAKNIRLTFRSKPYTINKYLLSLYCSHIQGYISYAIIARESMTPERHQ